MVKLRVHLRQGRERVEFFSFLKNFRPRRPATGVGQPPEPAPVNTPHPEAPSAGPPRQNRLTPEQVRQLLFDAVATGDEGKLDALCDEHKDVILQHGQGWLEVPAKFQSSPQISEWYGRGLQAIARYCAEKLNRQELMENLSASAQMQSPTGS